MTKHHGVSPGKFLLYIKEMEWRYNNRDCNLFDLLLKYMLRAVGTQSPYFYSNWYNSNLQSMLQSGVAQSSVSSCGIIPSGS